MDDFGRGGGPDAALVPKGVDWANLRLFATDVDGTLTDGGMYYTEGGEVMKRFDTRDAYGMVRLRNRGMVLAIITQENSKIVLARAAKLRIEQVHVNIPDKLAFTTGLLEGLKLSWSQLAYVGDDLNDLPLLRQAGFSACPADAAWQVRQAVKYVCRRPGGHGAVREACDLIEFALTRTSP